MSTYTSCRRVLLPLAVVALLTTTAAGGGSASGAQPGPSAATAMNAEIQAQNTTLVPRLEAAGGTRSRDGRFIDMPSGAEISLVPTALADCPSGSLCLWSDASFTGRMVRFSTPGTRTNLADVSFDNQLTSWANKASVDGRWFYDASLQGTTRCMNPGASLANVGSVDNDKASSVALYTDGNACT